ncbi:PEP-CTERM protein-sorting domain-containing protein [Colwellia chukchiensis]|uniref:PEP-CTERM protein-sorting domain-containing protein n=1 Tax=Colwellia chukchiensis TaxID=641665 RepID=A0A1H7KP41_9GAMM|nr:PEP-CTERM sorting domain-containing protein [Colwellia chukchiensis]SEK88508.1 PEP-CTERM protein-sorting domain-containing protein [Colwellia chukchiensis]
MFKNIAIAIIVMFAISSSPFSKAAIISSFDVDTELTILSDFATSEFDAYFDGEFLDIAGLATGGVSGSGDFSSTLAALEAVVLSAYAEGAVTGSPGSVDGFYLSSGELFIENTGASILTGEVSFDIAMFASIFTDTVDEMALAFSGLFISYEIYDGVGNLVTEDILFDDFIEFDSSLDGTGGFNNSVSSLLTNNVRLAADESILYYFELDAFGFADTLRAPTTSVPEPSTLVIFALGLVALTLRRIKR